LIAVFPQFSLPFSLTLPCRISSVFLAATKPEAYLLMGQVMEARCTQFVNPTRSYVCKMAKKYL